MASLRREGVDGLGEEGMDMIPKRKELDTSAPNFSHTLCSNIHTLGFDIAAAAANFWFFCGAGVACRDGWWCWRRSTLVSVNSSQLC